MKNTLKAAALSLVMAAPLASAQDVPVSIYMDLNTFLNPGQAGDFVDYDNNPATPDEPWAYDASLQTDVFNLFQTIEFNPVSTYIDDTILDGGVPRAYTAQEILDEAANPGSVFDGITPGDSVEDSAQGLRIQGLNPLLGSISTANFNNDWGLSIDWSLSGQTGIVPQDSDGVVNYLGSFNQGSIQLNFIDLSTNVSTQILNASLTSVDFSADPEDIKDSTVFVAFNARVDFAYEDVLYDKDGVEFNAANNDNDIDIRVSGDLTDLNNVPQQVGDTNEYTRQTYLKSFDIVVVPEPTSIAIMGLGLLGLGLSRKRKVK